MKLVKYSMPDSWEIEVSSEEEAASLLWPHICGLCRKGEQGFEIPSSHNLDSMLATPCGCEYGIEQ